MGDSGGECEVVDAEADKEVFVGEAKRVSVSTRSATRCGCAGEEECGGECDGDSEAGELEPDRAGGDAAEEGSRAGDEDREVAAEEAGVPSSAGMLITNLGRPLTYSSSSSAAPRPLLPLSLLLRLSPLRVLCDSASSSSRIAVEGEAGERSECSCCRMKCSVEGRDIQCRNRSCSGDGCSVSTSMAAAGGGVEAK